MQHEGPGLASTARSGRRSKTFSFEIEARKIGLILALVLIAFLGAAFLAACSSSQKAAVTQTLTGYTDPGVTDPATTQPSSTQPGQPPAPGSVEAITAAIIAALGTAGAIPTPIQPILAWLAALAPSALVAERLIVRAVAALPNSQSSSSSLSTGTAQPAVAKGPDNSPQQVSNGTNPPPAQAAIMAAVATQVAKAA